MRLIWKLHWPTTLFALALLPLFLGLGRWQLQRADQKAAAQIAFEERENALPQDVSQLPAEPELYTRVAATGHYDNAHSFLLDNRILHGRFGYEIITPFVLEQSNAQRDARHLLVNRGWIEGDPARVQRPSIAAVEGTVQITAYIYRDGTKMTFFGNGQEQQWPKLIQNLIVDDLQRQLGTPTYPFILRLDASSAGALRTEWQIVSMGPERHIAYAVQWFAMALTLIVVWLLTSSNLWQLIRGNKS
ncbi:MAG TPA: SURF1 family protein [Spongiibacteraceae bacterium]|nr:SURF1 family protein [Spongiibacteraceae bacterium]